VVSLGLDMPGLILTKKEKASLNSLEYHYPQGLMILCASLLKEMRIRCLSSFQN